MIDADAFARLILVFMQKADRPLHKDFILKRCTHAITQYGSPEAATAAVRSGAFPVFDA